MYARFKNMRCVQESGSPRGAISTRVVADTFFFFLKSSSGRLEANEEGKEKKQNHADRFGEVYGDSSRSLNTRSLQKSCDVFSLGKTEFPLEHVLCG